MLRKLTWLYVAGFLGIFIICHTPGLTDAEGRLLGLFRIDPIDDFVHLMSGVAGAIIAWRATYLMPLYIYETSFKQFDMGYGAALSWTLFLIIAVFTAIAFMTSKYWVYYAGDKKN